MSKNVARVPCSWIHRLEVRTTHVARYQNASHPLGTVLIAKLFFGGKS